MPKAKRKHSDTPTDFIAFDELLTKANKKIKTPPTPPHEFDFLSHEFDFPSHEFDFPSHEFDFSSKDDSLTLSENERQVINELAEKCKTTPYEKCPCDPRQANVSYDLMTLF